MPTTRDGNVRGCLLVTSLAGLMSVVLVAAPTAAKPDYEPACSTAGR